VNGTEETHAQQMNLRQILMPQPNAVPVEVESRQMTSLNHDYG
jgi:hypothetical protein